MNNRQLRYVNFHLDLSEECIFVIEEFSHHSIPSPFIKTFVIEELLTKTKDRLCNDFNQIYFIILLLYYI